MNGRTALACGACLVLAGGFGLGAQAVPASSPSVADLAIAQGRLDDAEDALFTASARAPRDPAARGALGAFLASRGRLKVGAVLLEEARLFGGDAPAIDARLARIFAWLGDWAAVAALGRPAAAEPDRERSRWLAEHPGSLAGADSVVVALEPNEMAGFGRIELTIGNAAVKADIDPDVEGLVLPSTPDVTGEAEQFGMRDGASVAARYAVSIGALRLTNVPARLSPAAGPAIGLDVLATLWPTFDPGSRLLTLRQRAVAMPGDSVPILLSFPGVKLVPRAGQPPVAMESAAGRAVLRGARWTFDVRHGVIVVQR